MKNIQQFNDRITALAKKVLPLMEVVDLSRMSSNGVNKTTTLQHGKHNCFKAQAHSSALTVC